MTDLTRFGVSIDKSLSERFDEYIREHGYTNRSEAIRDLMREALVRREWESGAEVAGGISLVYDHHKRELLNIIMDIQHDFHGLIISTQHVHISHHACLEVLIMKGKAEDIRCLFNKLHAVKGIKHIGITKTSTGI